MSTNAIGIMFQVEAVVKVDIVSMHCAELGEAAEHLRIGFKLGKDFVRFNGWWVGCGLAECSCLWGSCKILSPSLKGKFGSFFGEV